IVTGNTTVVTASLRDAAANVLASGGATVAFTLGSGTSSGTFGTVTDNANGSYTAVFTGTTIGTARAIGATVNGTAISSTLPTIRSEERRVGHICGTSSTVTVCAETVVSGAKAIIILKVNDAAGVSIGTGGA